MCPPDVIKFNIKKKHNAIDVSCSLQY